MENKIEKIIENLGIAFSSNDNIKATEFLKNIDVYVPFSYGEDDGKKIYTIDKESVGNIIPLYLDEENTCKVETHNFSILSVLIYLSNNNHIKGFILIDKDNTSEKLFLINNL